jgi:hypothetical protein
MSLRLPLLYPSVFLCVPRHPHPARPTPTHHAPFSVFSVLNLFPAPASTRTLPTQTPPFPNVP